jgi:hypothetical protein
MTRRDGHSVERTSSAHGIRAHLAPTQPIPDLNPSGEMDDVPDAIDRVARRSPDGGSFGILVAHGDGQILGEVDVGWRRAGETRDGSLEILPDGKGVRVDDLMIEHDTVERAVHAVIDVVCEGGKRVVKRGSAIMTSLNDLARPAPHQSTHT